MCQNRTEIDVERTVRRAKALLKKWQTSHKEIDRIVTGWAERASQWNSSHARTGRTADEIENRLVEEFRFDPLGLIAAILEDPITGERVARELSLEGRRFPTNPPAHVREQLATAGKSSAAAALFLRLATKLKQKRIGGARSGLKIKHGDWAVRNWFESIAPGNPDIPPNCLLDNQSLGIAAGFPRDTTDSALRTAISNWQLPRPTPKKRQKLAGVYFYADWHPVRAQ